MRVVPFKKFFTQGKKGPNARWGLKHVKKSPAWVPYVPYREPILVS
jgi:hypothetical protein